MEKTNRREKSEEESSWDRKIVIVVFEPTIFPSVSYYSSDQVKKWREKNNEIEDEYFVGTAGQAHPATPVWVVCSQG